MQTAVNNVQHGNALYTPPKTRDKKKDILKLQSDNKKGKTRREKKTEQHMHITTNRKEKKTP